MTLTFDQRSFKVTTNNHCVTFAMEYLGNRWDHQKDMTCGESNGHVNDGVTWPWKVKLVTSIPLEPNIAKTAGYAI